MPKAFLIRKKLSGRDPYHWRPVTPPPSPDEDNIGANNHQNHKEDNNNLSTKSIRSISPPYAGLLLSSPSSCSASDSDFDLKGKFQILN